MANHVCPWWLGYFQVSPLRRILEKPERIVGPYLSEGMVILDAGCGMGFFTIPMAQMVGTAGKVIAVDLQPRMLSGLRRRVEKAGLSNRIVLHQCQPASLGLADYRGAIDFALAFALVHEVPDRDRFFGELRDTLAPHGKLLVAEPPGRVTIADFADTLAAAERNSLTVLEHPAIRGKADRTALLALRP